MQNAHLLGDLADLVLVVHFAVVVFVVAGLPVVVAGNVLHWHWVNALPFRVAHLAAIGIVVVQAWLGQYCALTELESWLRAQAGQLPYEQSFVGHWLQRLLYYRAPMWVFTLAYTAFALLVLWAWWRFPPNRRQHRRHRRGA